MTEVPVATDEVHPLAEGPVRNAACDRLLWVDIRADTVFRGRLDGGRIGVTSRQEPDGTVGAVAVAADGALPVAAQDHLVVLRPDGAPEDGRQVVPAGQGRRLDDGAVDPAGRFVVGTPSLDGPSGPEVLVRPDTVGIRTQLDGDLTLSDGPAWSADGRCTYGMDTLHGPPVPAWWGSAAS
ncbi:SMP-30/gluconolactonase/LRE family protein [Geodermatophilus sp. URMC 60]